MQSGFPEVFWRQLSFDANQASYESSSAIPLGFHYPTESDIPRHRGREWTTGYDRGAYLDLLGTPGMHADTVTLRTRIRE